MDCRSHNCDQINQTIHHTLHLRRRLTARAPPPPPARLLCVVPVQLLLASRVMNSSCAARRYDRLARTRRAKPRRAAPQTTCGERRVGLPPAGRLVSVGAAAVVCQSGEL